MPRAAVSAASGWRGSCAGTPSGRTRHTALACARSTASLLRRSRPSCRSGYHPHRDRRRLALPGCDPRSVRPQEPAPAKAGGRVGEAPRQATMAVQRRHPAPGRIPYSQFASRQPGCRRRLPHDPACRRHRAILSRTANRWDNAPRESCFRTLKTTLVQISGFDRGGSRAAIRRRSFPRSIRGTARRKRSAAAAARGPFARRRTARRAPDHCRYGRDRRRRQPA